MTLTQEHANMLAAMLAASERPRPVSPGCPDGRSTWHTARRLVTEEDLAASQDWAESLGRQLVRRGLAAARCQFGVRRFSLTEAGLAQARRLVRSAS